MNHPLEPILADYPGGRPAFCKKVDVSEGRLSQILNGERASPRLAMAIHWETGGAVPASVLRPDLWRSPEDVPPAPTQAETAA